MITQTVNGLERRVTFRPAFHRVDEGYGVHGMEIHFYLKGEKGAVHFLLSTGMLLQKTWDWWKKEGKMDGDIPRIMHMGIDVGYHSPTPMFDGQEVRWPTKMRKTGPKPFDIAFDKIGDAPPVCDIIGVPCYTDGSALRADEWKEVFMAEGDDKIWEMLEQEYKDTFTVKKV